MLKKLGKYEIIEELGRGAMGIVYKAKDPMIGRLVAMKTITASLADQPELLERFFREAMAAGQMSHPNIVTIYDMGNEGGTPFIAMEFLEGTSLESLIDKKDQPPPLSVKLGYMLQVCKGLEYAHKRGVVHRDIKPANVMITKDGTIKVVDFGIARVVDTSKTQTGVLMGTVGYMSPEQVRGEKVDGRSDIWSTGVMFYEFLCGRRPFHGDNFAAVMLAIITQEPRPLKEFIPDCPPELEVLLQKFLKKDVTERFQTMDEAVLEMEPLYKKLQQSQVAELVAQGQKLIVDRDLTKARDVLRQVLQIDTAHPQAKTLLEKINAELKRDLVLPQIKDHIAKAEAALRDGKLEEAKSEGEAALKLDSVFEPAVSVMKQVEEALDRAKRLKSMLQASQQHMAEGSLTQADVELDKVLELNAEHPEARALKRQLAEEMAKRETRHRLQDTLQKARNLWTQQKFDDSIEMLEALKKEFPAEAEIKKLLETVLEDKADQQKSQHLAEARNLLGAQKFGEALAVIDTVLKDHPGEHAAQKLRQHIVQEQKETERRQRLEKEHAVLKKLVTEEKYSEVVAKGEPLLKDFPEDFELAKLVEYARTQGAQAEVQRKLGDRLKQLRDLMDKKEYEQAVKAAEGGLEAFPGNVDLLKMLNEARTEQKEKEKRDYVEKQIRSMKASIDKGNLTDAIDLGRQTLAQVKHDTDVTRLLHFAERESELRDKEKDKVEQLENATMLMSSAKFEEAVKVLQDIDKTHVFDPRVQELLKAAKEKKAPPMDATIMGTPGVERAAGRDVSAETQYVFRQAPGAPKAPVDEGVTAKAQAAQPAVGPTPAPVPPPSAPPKAEPGKAEPAKAQPAAPPTKEEKKKKKGAIVEEPEVKKREEEKKPAVAAGPGVAEPPAPPKPRVEPPPAVQPPPAPAPKPAPARVEPRLAPPLAVEAPKAGMSPAVMGIIGVVVLGGAIGGYVMLRPNSGSSTTGTGTTTTGTSTTGSGVSAEEKKQTELRDEAKKLADGEQYDAAVTKVDDALKINGPLNTELQKLRTSFVNAKKNADVIRQEKPLWEKLQAALNSNDFTTALATARQMSKLKGGLHVTDAEKALREIPIRQREETDFTEAKKLLARGDSGSISAAIPMLENVVKGTAHKAEAQPMLDKAKETVAKLGKDEQIKGFLSAGKLAVDRGDFTAARGSVSQVKQIGGDASSLEGQISGGETKKLNELVRSFNSAKAAKDTGGLTALVPEFTRLGGSGSSVAGQANDYANNTIPAAINDIKKAEADAAAAEADKQEKAALDKAIRDFNSAKSAKNKDALQGAVMSAFRNLAGSAKYGGQANDYINNQIPAALKAASWSCPVIKGTGGGASTGSLGQTYKAGDVVPATLLDAALTWTACDEPKFPGAGTIMLSFEADENGAITNVKGRAGAVDSGVLATVKTWKVTPPKHKGMGVKTTFNFDLKPQ